MLYFQIKYLYPLISKFVIIWSNLSYSGVVLKPPSFKPFDDFLVPFLQNQTISLHFADLTNFSMCEGTYYFDLPINKENFHRKCVLSSYTLPALVKAGIKENDFFFYGDVDEFPTIECVEYLIQNPPEHFINIQDLYSFQYTFRWDCGLKYSKFAFARFTKNLKKMDIVNLRYLQHPNLSESNKVKMIHMCSNFQSLEEFKIKMNAYAHTTFSKPFKNLTNCDLYLKMISIYSTDKCHFHKQLNIFPAHILNDPTLKVMFSPFPIGSFYSYFLKNCTQSRDSPILRIINKKINE